MFSSRMRGPCVLVWYHLHVHKPGLYACPRSLLILSIDTWIVTHENLVLYIDCYCNVYGPASPTKLLLSSYKM